VDVNNSERRRHDGWSIDRPDWGRCTTKGNKLYLHIFNWPADGKLEMPVAKGSVDRVYLLADRGQSRLPIQAVGDNVSIHLPGKAPDTIDSVVVLVTKTKK
jgi:alpha-L-fucosidase